MGANINPYNLLPSLILKAHSIKGISPVPEPDIKSHTGFPPWSEIKILPPTPLIEATCQKLRTDGPDLGGSLLFTIAAWQRHEWVMRTPLSRRDQAQSPGIATKYNTVFTHCNLIPQKRTKKRGFSSVASAEIPALPAAPWPELVIPEAMKWGKKERKTKATKTLQSEL